MSVSPSVVDYVPDYQEASFDLKSQSPAFVQALSDRLPSTPRTDRPSNRGLPIDLPDTSIPLPGFYFDVTGDNVIPLDDDNAIPL
ncbi:MAG: hypothetical protein R3C28_07545 [Pirellulaceae bacterium]